MRKAQSKYKIIKSLNSSSHSVLRPKVGVLRFPSLNLKVLWLLGFFLVLSLMVFYILQSNWIIREGYSVDSFQSRLTETKKENKKLEINFVENNSMKTIEERIENLNLVEINKINYIQLLGGQVAAK